MRLLLTGIMLLLTSGLLAQDKVSLKNEREGKSYYNSRSMRKAQEKALKSLSSKDIVSTFNNIISKLTEKKLCAFEINDQLNSSLKGINPKFNNLVGALHHLRGQNEIDDIALKIFLKADDVETTDLNLPKNEDDLWLPRDNADLAEMLKIIGGIREKLKTGCLEEVYQNAYSEITKIDKGIKSYHLEALFVEAYKMKLIDIRLYKTLEKSRLNDLEQATLNLNSYYKKVKSLRTHFPLRDATERSEFTTARFNKEHVSRRQHLLENYTDLQIMLMADVIKKLRSRLDSNKIEILVYERDIVNEVIPLEPMERFRFAIKILRKEMSHLALNTYFNGSSPDYMDLMTAAYETSIIPSVEMEELGGLQDIWNPKKSLWEKASVWVKTFGAVASLVIPPPYGFIPALALVVIEATTAKKKAPNTDGNLF